MKSELIAMPVFEERISPLLDVSERFALFEVKDKMITQKIIININAETDRMRIHKLKELGVAVIISGAVSRYLSYIIDENGIKHIPWISGRIDEVIKSFLNNTLQSVPPENGSCGGMMRKRKLIAGDACIKEPGINNKKENV
jgi:predicted Fe-Mo cluster-binding NifX family protein